MTHTFHIPVLGLGYSIDTPLKVAKFGISSVVSIVDDELIERMRKYHAELNHIPYTPIALKETDSRAKRITAYLNLLNTLVTQQIETMKLQDFGPETDLTRYFELLPETSPLKIKYREILLLENESDRMPLLLALSRQITPGSIDVNIMSKVDKANYNTSNEYTGDDYTDALAAMRGFSESKLQASIIISAGLNPRLFAYMERCPDFYPLDGIAPGKEIILKVSDYRSAFIQAKMLAKRGLWISEFRVESGLNCGGHAFATDGFLLGPILEEFKQKKTELSEELWGMYSLALQNRDVLSTVKRQQRITVQGGIGTADEHNFLLNYYQLDAAGWGSPFLLVPEATNVDQTTLDALITAEEKDFYLSNSSPLGILFNNFRKSSAEDLRLERIAKGRPGSPCKKKFLVSNTEFTDQPICTASREYQHLKIAQLKEMSLPEPEYQQKLEAIVEKICLCEGLCASTYLKNEMLKPRENKAVSICPSPNLAYFSGKYSLAQMVDHIYGRENLLSEVNRPNLFINELNLYLDYLKKDIAIHIDNLNDKKTKYYNKFSNQLQEGINYYKALVPNLKLQTQTAVKEIQNQLFEAEKTLKNISIV
ncbi:hypothetical protein AAKU52_001477 [Pedobacter sp. CG_S7]|uniref:hypothetical protein n=1 Tax=Pedobacter sp. CG_S7 TaxID=3143930 RepID=UPI00339834DD